MTAALKPIPIATAPPIAAVDLVLEAALVTQADIVWIEPVPLGKGFYTVSIERDGRTLSNATVDAMLASAMIARLAVLCDVDLTSSTTSTGSTRVRHADDERELVFTLRPGAELRGELLFVRRTPRLAVIEATTGELAPGQLVDHYRIVQRLGAGGMGCVYEVKHAALGRTYALKVLHAAIVERDANSIERFLREARAAARIHSPFIVDVFDFGYLADGRPYFVMELLPGTSLMDVIDEATMAPERAIAIAIQICEALAAAHDHGVIHADVTPSNVLLELEPKLSVKLVDFGLAELKERADVRAPACDHVFGTPCYISPEQIRGNPADERSDQYSLGVVLFEMLCGRPPFLDHDVRSLCMKHLQEPVPDPISPHGPLPDELGKILSRAMAKSPVQRFPSMRALRAELDEVARLVERRGWRRWLAP